MGMLTGVVSMVLITIGVIKVAHSPIGQALARRLHGKGGADPELREELLGLRDQVAELEHRLGESEERLDFAERMLAGRHEPERLPGGAPDEGRS
jgi:hypothetical protein